MALIDKQKLIAELKAYFPTTEGIQPETLFSQIITDIQNAPEVLTEEDTKTVRKVISCANTLYTVIEPQYTENKIDKLLRKLRETENDNA